MLLSEIHSHKKKLFPFTAYVKFELLKTLIPNILYLYRGRRGHDRKEVGFTTTNAISAYHHKSCEFESRS